MLCHSTIRTWKNDQFYPHSKGQVCNLFCFIRSRPMSWFVRNEPDETKVASVTIRVTVGERPRTTSNHGCKVEPSVGISLTQEFTLSCTDWIDANFGLPLKYSFYQLSSNREHVLNTFQESNFLERKLGGSGNVTIGVIYFAKFASNMFCWKCKDTIWE